MEGWGGWGWWIRPDSDPLSLVWQPTSKASMLSSRPAIHYSRAFSLWSIQQTTATGTTDDGGGGQWVQEWHLTEVCHSLRFNHSWTLVGKLKEKWTPEHLDQLDMKLLVTADLQVLFHVASRYAGQRPGRTRSLPVLHVKALNEGFATEWASASAFKLQLAVALLLLLLHIVLLCLLWCDWSSKAQPQNAGADDWATIFLVRTRLRLNWKLPGFTAGMMHHIQTVCDWTGGSLKYLRKWTFIFLSF